MLNHVRALPVLLLAMGCLHVAACSPGGTEADAGELMTREAFVEAYFQLRVEALKDPFREISVPARDRILQELGVTQDELLRFAEVRGTNPAYMEQIWDEVEARLVQPDAGARLSPDEEYLEADRSGR